MEEPHAEELGEETSTQVESSREGIKRTNKADRLLDDGRDNVAPTTSQHRHKRSPGRYIGYMNLMGKCVVKNPSSFKEEV